MSRENLVTDENQSDNIYSNRFTAFEVSHKGAEKIYLKIPNSKNNNQHTTNETASSYQYVNESQDSNSNNNTNNGDA